MSQRSASYFILVFILMINIAYGLTALKYNQKISFSYKVKSSSNLRTFLTTMHTTAVNSPPTEFSDAPGTLTELCKISKEACEAVSPMLKAFYSKIRFASGDSDTAKLKSDATFFSIADGIVQHLFIEYLFKGGKFSQIVGEEDETKVNILVKPFTVDDLIVPVEFESLVEETLEKIKKLGEKIDPIAFKGITAFVDPIDGTREFATGQGQYVTMLLGYNDNRGHPIAGIMYRPLTEPPTWGAGAKSERYFAGNLNLVSPPNSKGILVTDGKVSPFLNTLIDELGYEKVPSVASGNRAMMILEGKAGAYIRDTGGFSKWDTSGPQAVIEAFGGIMCKLPPFLARKEFKSYTHLKTTSNLDIEMGKVLLTLSNAVDKSKVKKQASPELVQDISEVREYACLSGLVTLDKVNIENIDFIHSAMLRAQALHEPTYT